MPSLLGIAPKGSKRGKMVKTSTKEILVFSSEPRTKYFGKFNEFPIQIGSSTECDIVLDVSERETTPEQWDMVLDEFDEPCPKKAVTKSEKVYRISLIHITIDLLNGDLFAKNCSESVVFVNGKAIQQNAKANIRHSDKVSVEQWSLHFKMQEDAV